MSEKNITLVANKAGFSDKITVRQRQIGFFNPYTQSHKHFMCKYMRDYKTFISKYSVFECVWLTKVFNKKLR